MRYSIVVAASAASLTMATPLEKRKMETTWVMEYDTVTVTEGEYSKPTLFWGGGAKQPASTTSVASFPVATELPVYQPSSVQPSVVVVTETPAAIPTTTELPTVQAPASSQAATSSAPTGTDFISVAIQHHNLHRSNHSAPAVGWSDELAGYASNTAATCKFAHDMNQGNGGYGQNLANWAQSVNAYQLGDVGAVKMAITDMWYNGEFGKFLPQYYGLASPPMDNFEGWGHFTQLLWKDSRQIGCASQFCQQGTLYDDMDAWFTVCNYSPAGNVGGSFAVDVLSPLGQLISTA
ncbi:PR-1-like protein [Rostrohypoxylon terebratum]|nr:PR-1-like protein [Rostrohypoxylon terebratum]